MLDTDAKLQKIEPDPNFFMMDESFVRQCVNVIDTTCGCINFFTCEKFERKFRTVCNGLKSSDLQ